MTFKQAADKFLIDGAIRKRNPMRPATIRVYRSQIESNLVPLIGRKSLEVIDGKAVKAVIAELSEQGLSPRTIQLNYTLIKQIRESVISQNGEIQFPCKWSPDFLDLPVINDAKQPIVEHQQVTDAISHALTTGNSIRAGLWAILAGTGLRISEARAITVGLGVGNELDWDGSKIVVQVQMTRAGFGSTKSKAGVREIDLAPELTDFMVAIWKKNFQDQAIMFDQTEAKYRTGLEHDGITTGFHSFRRFRTTHLRMQNVPAPLVDFWDGHAAGDMAERYTKVGGQIEERKMWAAKAGLGFKLPEIV